MPPPGLDLTVYGYNAARLAEGLAAANLHSQGLQAASNNSNAINIMNLHLAGDFDVRHGEVPPRPCSEALLRLGSILEAARLQAVPRRCQLPKGLCAAAAHKVQPTCILLHIVYDDSMAQAAWDFHA